MDITNSNINLSLLMTLLNLFVLFNITRWQIANLFLAFSFWITPLILLFRKRKQKKPVASLWVQTVWYDLFSVVFFLLGLSLLILSLPILELSSKSTSLSPGLCVCRPKPYNTISCESDPFSLFFVSSWVIVWEDGINRCSWCLAGGSGCWLKGLHQIPSLS